MANPLLEKIAKLPPEIIDHVYSEERGDKYERWYQVLKVDPKQTKVVHDLIWQVYLKELTLPEFVGKLQALLPATGKDLAVRIIGTDFMPFSAYLNADPSAYITELGGDPLMFRKRVTAEAVVDDVMRTLKTFVPGEAEQRRLRSILRSLVSEARTEKDVKDTLMKPFKLGGLGVSEPAAQQLLGLARTTLDQFKKQNVIIVDTAVAPEPETEPVPETTAPRSEESEAAAEAEEAAPMPKPPQIDATTPEDDKEIEAIKRRTITPASADDTAKKIAQSVDELYAASGLATEDEAMAKRIKSVIDSRLRDVRDSMETLEVLIQPKELGGLGLSQDAARALLTLIDAKLKAVHDSHTAQVLESKGKWVEGTKTEQLQAETSTKDVKQTDLERLYQSIVSKTKKPADAAAAPSAVPAPTLSEAEGPGKGAPPVNLPMQGVSTPAPVSPPLPAATLANAVRPPAPGAALAPSPVVPPTVGSPTLMRPRLEDVKPVAQLTGPVEELRQITVTDFRRLSKDPKEACLKVKDKIDLLAEQSFTKRSQGIAAWNASEVWRTYLDMMGEALAGKPMKDVIAARQQAKQPALTAEETQALADLSRQLRY